MLLNGINYPNKIIDDLNNNKLVIFAGAGVSMGAPTNLPDFKKLTSMIAEGTGLSKDKNESCDAFLGKLKSQGIPVNEEAAKHIDRACTVYNELHKAIVNVFKHDIKIVTTNYDQMFEQVMDSSVKIYDAPALPLGDDVSGLVHVHGNVNNPKYMVVTDDDFGKAYLTDSYVSRFIRMLFDSYTIVFIGYSYNDTIMRYLTRALSRDEKQKRYIITDDRKNNWEVLGLEPIYYPSRSHKVMRESIIKLGVRVKRSLIDWSVYFSEIADAPPLDPTTESEIDYFLEDSTRAQIMANSINGSSAWIEFLDKKQVFKNIFVNETFNTKHDAVWLKWLEQKVIGHSDETFKNIIIQNGKKVTSKLALSIINSLYDNSLSDSLFAEYLLLVEPYINNAYTVYALIQRALNKKLYTSCVSLFKMYWRIQFNIVNGSWISKDIQADYRHSFLGDYYMIIESWKKCESIFVNESPYELLIFFRSKLEELHSKYVRVGKATCNSEPWEIAMLVIEDRKENYHEDPLCAVSDILETLINSGQVELQFLRIYIQNGLQSQSLFVRKLFLKLLRCSNIFNADEAFDLVLKNDTLSLLEAKEQVFLLIQKIYNDMSAEAQNTLIDYIEQLEPNKYDSEYEKYNWCVWIQRIDQNNERINNIVSDILSRNDYAPRKHPELNFYTSDESDWEDPIAPTYKANLIAIDYTELIRALTKYENSGFEQIRHHKQMDVFADAISENYAWAKEISSKLISSQEYNSEIWQYFFQGVIRSNYSAKELADILFLSYKPLSAMNFQKDLGELLWKTVREDGIAEYISEKQLDLFEVCITVWNNRETEKPEVGRIIDLTLNTTIGLVLMSMMYIISFDPNHKLNEQIKLFFQENLSLTSWEIDVVVCVLAGNLSFLYYRDIPWCSEHLIPLLNGSNIKAFSSAWEGFNFFSKHLNRNVADAMSPVFLSAVEHIDCLSDETRHGFIEMYLVLLIYVITNPIPVYIPAFYKFASNQDRATFMREIGHRIKTMKDDSIEIWWNSWLQKYMKNLIDNRPVRPSEEELREVLYWLPYANSYFVEVVRMLCKIKLPDKVDGLFLHSLDSSDVVFKYSTSTVLILTKLLNSGNTFDFYQTCIKSIVSKLQDVGDKEMNAFKEALLKNNICMD